MAVILSLLVVTTLAPLGVNRYIESYITVERSDEDIHLFPFGPSAI